MTFLLRYTTDLWTDIWSLNLLSEYPWLQFEAVVKFLRITTSVMMVHTTIRYNPSCRVTLLSVLRGATPFLFICLVLAYFLRRMGLIRPVFGAPSVSQHLV